MEGKETSSKKADHTAAKTTLPVVIDLGSQKRKDIRKLENGAGKLMLEVDLAVEHARARLPDEDKDKMFVPVVIIYRRKPKRRPLPISPFSPCSLFR
ncbi:MAG TPA: hypothetical protein VGL29_02110 [Blastocatellia bacterium]|jgi:hypothetical protein